MVKHRFTSVLCVIIVIFMLLVTVVFSAGGYLGIEAVHVEPAYVARLFDTARVHTLDIVAESTSWDNMIANATAEEYIACNVVIDGDSVKNVGIRPKGNSSLTTIASSESDRYSFKIEFDHYATGQTYYGLDKLALNNIAQDNTYLKDYISYQMMTYFGADAPLCSFIYITVNGEDWGLYLAAEGIEDAFVDRMYGSDYGKLYKPDSMSMGGGNGDGGNNMGNMMGNMPDISDWQDMQGTDSGTNETPGQFPGRNRQAADSSDGQSTGGFDAEMPPDIPEDMEALFSGIGGMGGGMNMGSNDVALVYTDDEYDSYSNIFDNAKFDITDADKDRLISSIKQLNEGENLEEVVKIDEVLRYFVVHNFVLNFDSYTGSMMHNYYLYEENGQLSMIAWDYNLAFGGFGVGGGMQMAFPGTVTEGDVQGGSEIGAAGEAVAADSMAGGADEATTLVNYPIDTPVSGANMEDRPLLNQLLRNETYLEQYHALFREFITSYFDSGQFTAMVTGTIDLISPYVEKDPTAFCTYEEFQTAAETLTEFCMLRAESITAQLDGAIPATSDGQAADSSKFVDASSIDLSTMGSNASSFNNRRGGMQNSGNKAMPAMNEKGTQGGDADTMPQASAASAAGEQAEPMLFSAEGAEPVTNITENGGERRTMPNGEMPPDMADGNMPDFAQNGEMPEWLPEQGEMPEGIQGMPNMAEGDTAQAQGEAGSAADGETESPTGPDAGGAENAAPENGTDAAGNNQTENRQNSFPDMMWQGGTQSTAAGNDAYPYILFGASIVFLAGGLIFAKLFK